LSGEEQCYLASTELAVVHAQALQV